MTNLLAQCTFTSSAAGSWSSITWTKTGAGCGSNTTPGPNDDVVINHNVTLTLTATLTVKSISIARDRLLTVNGSGFDLMVTGNVDIDNRGELVIGTGVDIRVYGRLFVANNGNVAIDGSGSGTAGTLYVQNCVQVGGGGFNQNVISNDITWCVRCPGNSDQAGGPNSGTNTCNLLPLELLDFRATLNDQRQVYLSWRTVNERNVSHFEIQKTLDPIQQVWTRVGQVNAVGDSPREEQYQLVDNEPFTGISYYRLRMVDRDGTFSFSDVRAVALTPLSFISLYPNPATGEQVQLLIYSPMNQILKVSVYDVLGRTMTQEELQARTGLNERTMYLPTQIPAGYYLIQLSTADGKTRLQKQLVLE